MNSLNINSIHSVSLLHYSLLSLFRLYFVEDVSLFFFNSFSFGINESKLNVLVIFDKLNHLQLEGV